MASNINDNSSVKNDLAEKRRVLVTGAAGRIGTSFANVAHKHYNLRLMVSPRKDGASLSEFGEVVQGDLSNLAWLKEICSGIDTVVHLAASASASTLWENLLQDNIIGTYHLFAAACAAKCRRVVFASSIHAVSGYPASYQIHPDDPVNPGDLYGVSKCFGESLGRYMAVQHGLSTIVLRIGAFQLKERAEKKESLSMMNLFVSHQDLDQLICKAIDKEDIQFGIFHGLSDNLFERMSIDSAKEQLDYNPEDDFTELNEVLRDLHLRQKVKPHNENHGIKSGLRNDIV